MPTAGIPEEKPLPPTITTKLAEDGKGVVITSTRTVSQVELTQKLSSLQNQAAQLLAQSAQINDAIAKVQESLALFTN